MGPIGQKIQVSDAAPGKKLHLGYFNSAHEAHQQYVYLTKLLCSGK
jgi:hypothetical protein